MSDGMATRELVRKPTSRGHIFTGHIGEMRVRLFRARVRADGTEVWQLAVIMASARRRACPGTSAR